METGELAEEDVVRVSGPSSLPPMVGGNEQPPHHDQVPHQPPAARMVEGDSLPPPPLPGASRDQRLVEGDTNESEDVQVVHVQPPPLPTLPMMMAPPVAREVEGQSHPAPPSLSAQQQLPR